MKKTVLVIKLGYCETLVTEDGFTPSLGDVFRHTVLLHHYANDHVTWLTSESAAPLLKGNPYIHELLIYGPDTDKTLKDRAFDELLCLEKSASLCKFADNIRADRRLGFHRNGGGSGTSAHHGAECALDIANGGDSFVPIQSLLFQMVGDYWRGEGYILGYKPTPVAAYDIGLNIRVGGKWPSKAWPAKNWEKLAEICTNHGLKVSWQQGESDIEQYMDWIAASRLIVTCDSLGMHLALSMGKKVVALFGPTSSEQIYMYGRGVILSAEWACSKAPCMLPQCPNGRSCMQELKPKIVARAIVNILNGRS
jgi:heptosyltransferase-2